MKFNVLFSGIILILLISCKDVPSKEIQIGQVDLTVTGNPEAQELFSQGLAYLHSFEYLDALDAFTRAQKADPTCGMAYWGELMAYNHPLFNRELSHLVPNVFTKMGANEAIHLTLFNSEMERDLYKSLRVLYGEGSKSERDLAYRIYFEELSKKYPDNHEIQAFYALSLLASPRVKKTESLFDKAGEISQKILDENPEHPGALHYLIHSYDSPDRAYKAKEAADKYAKAAPDAAHALHMPSHIYLALGEWDNVVTSNIESWNASVTGKQKMSRKELGYHSLSWLQYGLLQRGEHELAKRLVQDMIYYASKDNSSLARTYFVAMKGTHLSATNEWDDGIANAQTKTYDLHLTKRSGHKFLEGMQAYYKKDKKTLKEVMKSIAGDKYRSSLDLGDQTLVMCNTAGNPAIPPNQMDIDIVSILEYELQSRLYKLEGNTSEELAVLKKGTELYNQLNMSFGPPVIFIPIHEMYAESLLDQKMYKEALEVADNGLKTTPRKLKLLQMKLQAATALENGKIIQEVQELITNQTSEKVRGEVLKF